MNTESARPVALVTGARRGIGRACCAALAARGFEIVVNARAMSDDVEQTMAAVVQAGGRAAPALGDIADLDDQDRLLDQATGAFGRLDCLVNNAGVSVLRRGDLLDVSVASYDRCQSINTRAAFFLIQRFARYLLNAAPAPLGHRSVVVISSCNAEAVAVNRGEYCVSKAASGMVAKVFATRLAAEGIGVYDVRPGIIATEMTAPSRARYDEFFAAGGAPMPRWGEPEEIGRAVAAAAAGDLPYSVGQVLKLDGGLTIPRF